MFPKDIRYQSKCLRDAAKGQPCMLQIDGICNHDDETTVLCHLPDESGTGVMGGKTDDLACTVLGCFECHQWLDRRAHQGVLTDALSRAMVIRVGQIRTIKHWREIGVLKVA